MRSVLSAAVFLFIFSSKIYSQEVDLVRLGYASSAVSAKQIGMAVSADGNLIAFVYNDKTVKIFDITANKFVKRFTGPYATLFDVHLTPTNIILIGLNEVQIWNWKEERLVKTFSLTNQATKTTFSGKHNLLAVGQKEGTVGLFNVEKAEQVNELLYKTHHISALAFHPNGKSIVVGVMTFLKSLNPLKQFDVSTGTVIASSSPGIYSMAVYNETGTELVTSGMNALGLKTVLTIFDGTDLSFIDQLEQEVIILNALIPYGGIVADKKLLAITASSSFNVYDLPSGQRSFTTMSDKVKLPAYGILGVGSFNVYPLSKDKVLFNGSKNNINQIYDVKTNSIVGYFFSDSNDDFAIVSRDGRVDGTPDALEKVYWTAKNSSKKTSLESTFEQGFAPRLLGAIVGDKAMPQQEFKVEQAKIPVISLQSFNGKAPGSAMSAQSQLKAAKFDIQVKEHPQEITELKLFQNGKLVKTLPGNGSNKYSVEATLNTSFGEDNFFYLTAGSKSGIESEKIRFTVVYKGATEDKPKLYLVTIGINKYKNAKYNLNYAQADADGVEKAIKTNSGSLFKEVVPYNIRNDKAVKATILATLDDIKKKSLQQDVLIVYYAGHGVMTQGENGEFYIVPHDIIQLYGKDDILKDKGISATMLKQYAQEINAQKQVFILDACQSAGALETVAVRGAAEEKAIAQLARSTGTFWIMATGSNQFATEFEKLGHGIFTYALLDGINGAGDANRDKKLTVRELSTFIENKVPELSEKYKGSAQFPSAYSFGNDFPIVIYKE
jgi:WD40 repeat protein